MVHLQLCIFKLMSTIKTFRIVALLEGISFLLFAISMPLKYGYDILWPNKIIGMAHGVLFLLYIVLVGLLHFENKWGIKRSFWAVLASLLPFGTFVADSKVFKPYQTLQKA